MNLRIAALAGLVIFSLTTRSSAFAQVSNRGTVRADSTRRVKVIPGAQYRAGWLHKAILGEDYRALWTSEIEVEVLDLQRVAGGLKPTQRGGSMQTNSLRFAGADGKEYVFRPSEKDFTKGLPPELRETLVRDIAQDQVAGYHPAAAVIVARMLDATGIRHPRPVLVVMPDDPALGEFRADFAGVFGTFEERPGTYFDETPESTGATDVISSERLFERMRRNHENVVDARAYLSARLFDILVGDRDRHRDQWHWGRFSSQRRAPWEPIPRDRDMAFARFDGLAPWVVRGVVPQLITFGHTYPDMVWLNWNAREIDRRLLVGLERPVWDSLTTRLQTQLSDALIDSAIVEMPPPFVLHNGKELSAAIINRRERLPQAAREFYRILAKEVDFSATDVPDVAEVTRYEDGSVHVALFPGDSSGGRQNANDVPYLQRRFVPDETREVRVLLHAGNDRVIVRGRGSGDILVRVIGGDGDDVVADSVAEGDPAVRFYDSAGEDRVESARGIPIDREPYAAPTTARVENAVRDWGTWSFTQRSGNFSPTIGLVVGLRHARFRYGFRSDPFASRSTIGLDVSLGERRPRLVYDAAFRPANSRNIVDLRFMASGLELIRFHGLGNETPSDRETKYYRVFQNLFRFEPTWIMTPARNFTLSCGVLGQYTATPDDARTLVGEAGPYGSGKFGEVGARVGLDVDRRDSPTAPTKGFRLTAGGTVYPALWSVESAYGEANVSASTYLTARSPVMPTLALRAGGQHVWGTFPFHDAAFVGGASTLRGWDQQRFAGRSSLYGSAELRLFLSKVRIVVPADFGVMGIADAGRVYVGGETSDTWHTGVGGGLWLAPLMRSNTVSLSIVRGRERTGVYAGLGFAF